MTDSRGQTACLVEIVRFHTLCVKGILSSATKYRGPDRDFLLRSCFIDGTCYLLPIASFLPLIGAATRALSGLRLSASVEQNTKTSSGASSMKR
jgi:hypothetical protein